MHIQQGYSKKCCCYVRLFFYCPCRSLLFLVITHQESDFFGSPQALRLGRALRTGALGLWRLAGGKRHHGESVESTEQLERDGHLFSAWSPLELTTQILAPDSGLSFKGKPGGHRESMVLTTKNQCVSFFVPVYTFPSNQFWCHTAHIFLH